MNTLLLIILFVIILISLWTFLSAFKGERQVPPGGGNISPSDAISREILTEKTDSRNEEDTARKPRRRKTDFNAEEDAVEIDDDFHVPYPAEEIIPEQSPFELYRQALYNAQELSQKGDFATALTFYEGVKNRVSDADIKEKIEEDIDYLHNYHQIAATREKTKKQKQRNMPNEVKLSIDGIEQLPEIVTIDLAPKKNIEEKAIDELIEKISEKIHNKTLPEATLQKVWASDSNLEKLHQYQADITGLKTEIEELHQIKNTITEQNRTQLEQDKETINQLQQHIEELKKQKDDGQEVALLKDQIEALKQQQYNEKVGEIETLKQNLEQVLQKQEQEEIQRRKQENQALQQQLTSLQDEVSRLEEYKTRSSQLEKQLEEFVNQNLQNEKNIEQKTEMLSEIGNELKSLQEAQAASPQSSPAIPQPAVASNAQTGAVSSTITPSAGDATLNLQKPEMTKDKKDDFELLSDYIKGEQYEEPEEEEIYEKILQDAIKDKLEKAQDLERKEESQKEKQPNYDNVVYIDRESSQRDDEEFYDKFSRYYNRRKKELPILRVSYNFSKLPDASSISHEKNVMAHSFYKYKPMLEKANEYIKMRRIRDAINYYQVVLDQKIPEEFKVMIKKNIEDLNDYLEKYLYSG